MRWMTYIYVLCTKPPACVLFSQENSEHPAFKDLEAKVLPVFPIERSIKIKEYSVRRRQVPIWPAFGLTDYKIQGSTLITTVLDIKMIQLPRVKMGIRNFALCMYSCLGFDL